MRRGPRGWIIHRMSGGLSGRTLVAVAAVALVGAGGAAGGGSPLDGLWTWTWPRAEMLGPRGKGCDDAAHARTDAGPWSLTLAHGRYVARNLRSGWVDHGSISVAGDVMTFVLKNRHGDMLPGRPYRIRFSLYRDRITFTDLPGRLCPLHLLTLEPWTRASSG